MVYHQNLTPIVPVSYTHLIKQRAGIFYRDDVYLFVGMVHRQPKTVHRNKFCNQRFYNGELVAMTTDKGEKDVLQVIQTVPGNHARGHFNQREIDRCV